jgi:hypothetical protein
MDSASKAGLVKVYFFPMSSPASILLAPYDGLTDEAEECVRG